MQTTWLAAGVALLGLAVVPPATGEMERTPKKKAQAKRGPRGPRGLRGLRGVAGPAGAVGPQGPQGPQGPAGERGPAGPGGPAGPAGANGANGTNGSNGARGATGATGATGPASTVSVIRSRTFTGASDLTTVHCPVGTVATGGGGQRSVTSDLRLTDSYPDPPTNGAAPTGWSVGYEDPTPGDGAYDAWAVCAPGS